jgi:ketosteroid isomerase-like protein
MISMLTSFGGTVAAMAAAAAVAVPTATADPVRSVQQTYAQANLALLRGDAKAWNRMMPMGEDFVLFSPFGGKPSRYADYTPERFDRMSKFFKNGTFSQEVVQSFATDDMIVLATIERCNVSVGGLPAQDWALRVTSVFRREGNRWVLAHRHADPLVEEVSIEESARLARGERTLASK